MADARTYLTNADDRHIAIHGAIAQPHTVDGSGGLIGGLNFGALRVYVGIYAGPVQVTVEALDTPPGSVGRDWEDVVELSFEATDEPVFIVGPYVAHPPIEARLDLFGPGWYRLRLHASGRDLENDEIVTEPVEKYLAMVWLQEPSPPRALAVHSGFGRLLQSHEAQYSTPPARATSAPVATMPGASGRDDDLRLRADAAFRAQSEQQSPPPDRDE